MKQQTNEIKRMQQLAGLISEDQSQLSQDGLNAAMNAKKAIEILLRQSVINSDDVAMNTLTNAINILDSFIS